MDIIQPSLNNNIYANRSSYNTGAKGYIREKSAKGEKTYLYLSLIDLTRQSKATIELHSKNRLGTFIPESVLKKCQRCSAAAQALICE